MTFVNEPYTPIHADRTLPKNMLSHSSISHSEKADVFKEVSSYLQQLRGEISEPVRIREEELATHLGVSRTPVREALIRLECSGLVTLRPGRGALLAPVTDTEYLEWLQIREQLEAVAAREAALNASKRDVDFLKAIFEPFQGSPFSESASAEYAKSNVLFHQEIVRISGNTLLNKLWASLGHLQTSYRRQTISRLHRQQDSLLEHMQIIAAIERRDGEEAEKLARHHVQKVERAVRSAAEGMR